MLRAVVVLLAAFAALLVSASRALAHGDHYESFGHSLVLWNFNPLLLAVLLGASLVYARGFSVLAKRGMRGSHPYRRRAALYTGGIVALFLALVSPIDVLSSQFASAHMVQHILLIQVAAPLLVLGSPLIVAAAGSRLLRRSLASVRRRPRLTRSTALLIAPVTVLLLHGLAVLGWHLPVPYNLALTTESVHLLQHGSFLLTGVLFWWLVLPSAGRQPVYPTSIALVFVMAVISGGLGSVLSMAPGAWYSYQPITGLSPIEDQQLAGALMWVVGGFLYAIAAAAAFFLWLKQSEQRASVKPI